MFPKLLYINFMIYYKLRQILGAGRVRMTVPGVLRQECMAALNGKYRSIVEYRRSL